MTIDRREGITRRLYDPKGESRRQNLKRQLIQRKRFEGQKLPARSTDFSNPLTADIRLGILVIPL
ncbi:hypothetical protein [Microcoleus vaginatus]|uniref:hypothetical protein n=1 Tax=Microcoleus vaginatus TaxID=119532 RepID=UPI001F61EBC9